MSKILGGITILASIVVVAIWVIFDIRVVFDQPLLSSTLAFLFLAIVPFAVAYLSARSYLMSGSPILLLLGGGVLAFGAGVLVASGANLIQGRLNLVVTAYATGNLLGSALHFVGTTLVLVGVTSKKAKGEVSNVLFAYAGVIVFTTLIVIATVQGTLPPFFILGEGFTFLRQVVVVTAIVLFAVSSINLMKTYLKVKTDLLFWYSLALALIPVGLLGSIIAGASIGWPARIVSYLAGIYFLIAVLTTIRRPRSEEA